MRAVYRVHIPTSDKLGFPLHKKIPSAAHQWLYESQPRIFDNIWTEGPHRHSYGFAHHLVTLAEDTPESDGYIKQLAAHVGEISNHPFITASKQGKTGVQSWDIPNLKYLDGVGAAPQMLDAGEPDLGQASIPSVL